MLETRSRRCAALVCALTALGGLTSSRAGADGRALRWSTSQQADDAAARGDPYAGFAAAPVFLPRSYLYGASPSGRRGAKQRLVFGLEYAFHLPAYNDLREKAARGGRWAGAANLSFAGALRMLRARSRPIRMPSYRPSLSGQVFRIHYGPLPVIWGLTLEISHHSNGQERCLFDVRLNDQTPSCTQRIADVEDPAAELNRLSGSFANNAVGLGFDTRVHAVDSAGVAVSHLAAGMGLAGHGPGYQGRLGREMRLLYGAGHLRTHVEYQQGFRYVVLRVAGDVRHYFRTRDDVPATAGWITWVARPHATAGLGFFVRYYGGRDFYNAFFVDRIQQFSAGLSWDAERPLRFATPAE